MSPYTSFILGILLVIAIIVPFWILSGVNSDVGRAYSRVFCDQVKLEDN